MIRLNKYLSEAGVCSRREADRLIEAGRVTVDGVRAVPGMKVSEKQKNNIIRFLHYPVRVTYAGRLDKDSEGLLIMTNDGELINSMMRARYHHEKEYHVRVDKEITSEFVRQMSEGVHIQDVEKNLDAVTRPCEVKQIGKYTFSIILTQGLNRQIRRMCEALGYKVTKLVRIRIMNVELGSLKSGAVRKIEGQELKKLYEQAGTHEGTGGAFE